MNREEIIRRTAQRRWGVSIKAQQDDIFPEHLAPTERRLAEWLPDCPPEAMREASTRLRLAFALGPPLGSLDPSPPHDPNYSFVAVDLRREDIKPNDEVTDPLALAVARQDPESGGLVLLMTIDRLHDYVVAVQKTVSRVRTDNGHAEGTPEILQPLTPLVEAWQKSGVGTPVSEANIRVVGGMTRRPYEVSDVVRTTWEDAGGGGILTAVKVDGVAVAALVSEERCQPSSGRLLKPAGAQGELILEGLGRGRDALGRPTVIWAYSQFAQSGQRILGEDVVTLIELAHLFDEPVIWKPRQLVSMMARGRDGGLRTPKKTDFKRLMDATAAARSLLMPVTDSCGQLWWHDVVDVSQDCRRQEIRLGRPMWAMTRRGRFTLTATLGKLGWPRLVCHQSLRRAITGLEYWLARSAPPSGKGTAGDLRPVRPGGPGNWRELKMRQFLQLCGEPVGNLSADRRRKAFQRIRDRLEGDGNFYRSYVVPGGNPTKVAPAGDTVEVCLDKPTGKRLYGRVLVRASALFCEAAQRAQRGQYEKMPAATYLGRPLVLSDRVPRTSTAPAKSISTSRERCRKRVAREPHP